MQKLQKNTLPDLSGYRKRLEVIQQIAAQIEKDLNLSEPLAEILEADQAYNQLMKTLIPIIKGLLQLPNYHLKSLLYRIDISEKKIGSALAQFVGKPEEEIISHLIIERELQKVVFRMTFKQNKAP